MKRKTEKLYYSILFAAEVSGLVLAAYYIVKTIFSW